MADSNGLLRTLQPHHPHYERAAGTTERLLSAGEAIYIVPQIVRELWNACTRPIENNGLGFTAAQAEREISKVEVLFPLLPDTPDVHTEWRHLVVRYGVLGVRVHDANLVAAMVVHGISHLLTFNAAHFQRYSSHITVVAL